MLVDHLSIAQVSIKYTDCESLSPSCGNDSYKLQPIDEYIYYINDYQ